ncbi:olee1-like protein [Cajanus cajan]|uniref:Olee1-like protein n=1 Tax=Cajanus cajan TaxID=3821 RepID=A0A151RT85_CAJCA|nr:olee1-like protein [Cajanus cajan]KYP45733.1 Olee1-like protein [Cajanus cajan]
MAKSTIVIALCFLSFVGLAYSQDRFFIEGKVYCDTCRTQFLTRVSEFMPGATVRVECKKIEGGEVIFSKEVVTDGSGSYKIAVDGDHQEEVCQIKLVKSSRADCGEVDNSSYVEKAARISLTKNNGIVSPIRNANPLGFLVKDPLPVCNQIFQELGLLDDLEL